MPAVTGTPTTFGGIGKLEFAPTNNPDDPNPTYVDLTPFLRTEETPLSITRGRQSELDTIQSSQLTAVLDNSDNRFTFGLTTGAYGANWAPAKKVRYSETIGSQTFVLYTGYIEYPDIPEWHPIGYHEVQLTCTDRLTRLARGTPFASALGAFILNTASLKGYWPMTDVTQPFRGLGPVAASMEVASFAVAGGAAETSVCQPRTGLTPAGGESSGARFLTGQAAGVVTSYTQASWPISFNPAMAAGDSATIVMWISVTGTTYITQSIASIVILGSGSINLNLTRDLTTGAWTLAATGALAGTVSAGSPGIALFPVGIRLSIAASTMELWVGGQRFTTTLTGTPPTGNTLFQGNFGGLPIDYDLSHMQVYVGQSYSYANFLAQIAQGYTPLAYQTTGQRINTILDYAGVPGDQRVIDPGVSYMQAAELAGATPGDALANAVATERGRGFIDGQGRYVFHDRIRVYNV